MNNSPRLCRFVPQTSVEPIYLGDWQVKLQRELRQPRATLTVRMLVDGHGSGHSEFIDQGEVDSFDKVSCIDLVIMEK